MKNMIKDVCLLSLVACLSACATPGHCADPVRHDSSIPTAGIRSLDGGQVVKPLLKEHTPFTTDRFEGVSLVKRRGASNEELLALAADVRPSWRQLRYHERGMAGFLHWGMNVFTGEEWGTGKETPKVFKPDKLDTDQWVKSFRDAGISCIILVAKHHDGFCLWPSQYTNHCVKNSPWKNGQGDVVREFVDSCRKYGTAVGMYYSPWDMHEKAYGTEAYNDYMIKQLGELLTGYGPVDIVWFDGAGQDRKVNGRVMPFDWPRIHKFIRKVQPRAVISGGADSRWVGNESGKGRSTQWAVQSVSVDDPLKLARNQTLELNAPSLGDIKHLRKGSLLHWLPARGGLPTRAGWFWRPNTDHTVRTLHYMVDSYFSTVGQNSHIQINLAPDKHGQAPPGEQRLFKHFGSYLRKLYSTNYAEGAQVTANTVRQGGYAPERLLDSDPYTCWAAEDNVTRGEIVVTLPEKRTFNVIKLQENVKGFGQRISRFAVDVFSGDEWRQVFEGTTVGFRRLARFEMTTTDRVRIRILEARVCATLATVALFRTPAIIAPPSITRDRKGKVSIAAARSVKVHYTTDGREPSADSPVYAKPFDFPRGGLVKALAVPRFEETGVETGGAVAAMEFGLAPAGWRIVGLTSAAAKRRGSPSRAVDANARTSWDTAAFAPKAGPAHALGIDLGKTQQVTGFSYLPEQKAYKGMVIPSGRGLIRRYAFYVSKDGKRWGAPLCEGEFGNIKNNPVRQVVRAKTAKPGRYVRFVAKAAVQGRHVRAAEIGVLVMP